MTDALALLGMLAVLNAVGLGVVALYVYRMREQTRHCIQIVTTLLRAYEAETGTRVAVDPNLLGEPLDVVAEDGTDEWSKLPPAEPWEVR